MQHPGKRRESGGWDWSSDDIELVTFKSGDQTKKIIVGRHEFYGRGVFCLKKESGIWRFDEALGRPKEILGLEIKDDK